MSGGLSLEEHLVEREKAELTYTAARDSSSEQLAWAACLNAAREEVKAALQATADLTAIPHALQESGRYSRALRFMLAPPLSQDQFRLICPSWPKASEKKKQSRLPPRVAAAFEEVFESRRDRLRTVDLRSCMKRKLLVETTAILIATTEYATGARMTSARSQQDAFSALLEELGMKRIALGLVDEPGKLPEGCFACATKFATGDGSSHEVDLAVGLPKKVILAVECKVSNDQTNSVKRINDVLKKATAWKKQWGKFVVTGALLQGVFSPKEPRRLIDNDVEIFWSHRLDLLRLWLEHRL